MLLQAYEQMLVHAANLEVVDGGVVAVNTGDAENVVRQPVTIGGKTLHLPTPEFLAKPDWEHFIPFHPLSELPRRGESEVLRLFRGFIVANMNQVLTVLMEELVRIGADKDMHKRLSATASECLDAIPKADAKSVKDMIKVLEQMDETSVRDIGKILDRLDNTNRRKLVNFYLKRSGKYKGKEYARVCVVDFPFMATDEDGDSGEREIFGVKLRVNDYKGFKKLLAFILDTDESNGEKYNSGSNSMTAPYLTVLLESWFKLANRLNKMIKIYSKYVPILADLKFDTSWHNVLEDFQTLLLEVPPLEGNRGVALESEAEPAAQAEKPKVRANKALLPQDRGPVAAEEPVAAPAPVTTQSVPAVATQAPVANQGLTWAEIQARKQQAVAQPAPQPVYQQPIYQQPVYQQPVYQQPYQQPPVQQNWAAAALAEPVPMAQVNAAVPTNPLRAPAYGRQTMYQQPQYQQQPYQQPYQAPVVAPSGYRGV